MSSLDSFASIDYPCDQALDWLARALSTQGLRMLRTFDLQNARTALGECPCPHHGTETCDCQMVVVLIYGKEAQPATLVLHGSDGRTWLSLVDNPLQRLEPGMQASIQQALRTSRPEQNPQ